MAQTFEAWWATIGPIAKSILIISVLCTAGFSFGFASPYHFAIDYDGLIWKLQLWRPITAMLFLGKFGFIWLINLGLLVTYIRRHEDEEFAGRRADLVWMIAILCAALHAIAFLFNMPFIAFSFSMSLVWVWCKRHEQAQLTIMSFAFKAGLFPWAMTAFHLILGQDFMSDLIGIAAGHIYFFLADIFPKTHGYDVIRTPQFLYNWMPNQRLTAYGVHAPPSNRGPMPGDARQEHRWGTGRPLGAPQ